MRLRFLLAPLLLLATSACAAPPDCGVAREGGGPPLLVTREAELCENVRTALILYFDRRTDWTEAEWEKLVFDARYWSDAPDVDVLIARIVKDGGQPMADIVARNIHWTRTRSALPYGVGEADRERALTRAAGHGAWAAVDRAWFSAEGDGVNVELGNEE